MSGIISSFLPDEERQDRLCLSHGGPLVLASVIHGPRQPRPAHGCSFQRGQQFLSEHTSAIWEAKNHKTKQFFFHFRKYN